MVGFNGFSRMPGCFDKHCITCSQPACMECSRTGARV